MFTSSDKTKSPAMRVRHVISGTVLLCAGLFVSGVSTLRAQSSPTHDTEKPGKSKTVLLDYFFNNEHKKDKNGQTVRYHYTWEDQANSGFSLWGNIFRDEGFRTDSLIVAPDEKSLKNADVYIIVDPDNDKESPSPNYMDPVHARKIYDWVKKGGVLVMMMNDSGNAEFHHFNQLPERFGIYFNEDRRNKVDGNNYEMGALQIPEGDSIFPSVKKIYIKEICTLKIVPPAKAHYRDGKDVIMAVAKVGKGTVFAVGDPWFYNEYTDGKKLPADYDNAAAARDLTRWLARQIPVGK